MPIVSVVIPTLRRPVLVLRALSSVIAQTLADIEIIVVIDGPDQATADALSHVTDPRLVVIHNPSSMGAGAARNHAASRARGTWLAFLDDDDAWLPEKLERQLAAAGDRQVLVSCRSRVVTPHGVYTWPRRLYVSGEPIDEYLFDRRTLLRGDTHVGTSSYLLPRTLFDRTTFGDTSQQEDNTLLLRVTKQAGCPIVMIPDILVVLYKEEARESLGNSYQWREMLAWIDSMGDMITRRAYSGFCLIYLGAKAARTADYAAFPLLLKRAFGRGAPTFLQLAPFLLFWVVPVGLRQRIRALAGAERRKPPQATPAG